VKCCHNFLSESKGNFSNARKSLFNFILVKAIVTGNIEKSDLSRIAYCLAVFIHYNIITEGREQWKSAEVGKFKKFRGLKNLFASAPPCFALPRLLSSVHKHLFHSHFVQGECAGLVRANIGHRAECFHGREFPDEGVFVLRSLLAPSARDIVITAAAPQGLQQLRVK